ncbi:MAG: hypothetical protein AAGJ35_08410 [Myxococcota bacterium]
MSRRFLKQLEKAKGNNSNVLLNFHKLSHPISITGIRGDPFTIEERVEFHVRVPETGQTEVVSFFLAPGKAEEGDLLSHDLLLGVGTLCTFGITMCFGSGLRISSRHQGKERTIPHADEAHQSRRSVSAVIAEDHIEPGVTQVSDAKDFDHILPSADQALEEGAPTASIAAGEPASNC